jgi:hypothetical protein
VTRDVSEAELVAAMTIGRRAVDAGGDYLYTRVLGNGYILCLLPWSGAGVQLSLAPGFGVFDDTWNYDAATHRAGWRAALGWDGHGEPEGWYRHPRSGRRRPGGDPEKEFVRP